jgi:hypothetical protein
LLEGIGTQHQFGQITKKDEEFWLMLQPYLDANRHDIHKYVSILSDIKIQPTAINPMTGMQSLVALIHVFWFT